MKQFDVNQVGEIVELLSELPKLDRSTQEGRLEVGARRTSTTTLTAAMAGLALIAVLGVVHRFVFKFSSLGLTAVLLLVALVQLLAVIGLMMQMVSGITSLVRAYRKPGHLQRQECLHDLANAAKLLRFSPEVRKAANQWLKAKTDQEDRRLGRFFGSSSNLGFLALIAGGWGAWKEVGQSLPSFDVLLTGQSLEWKPTTWLFILAGLGGVIAGGFAAALQNDRRRRQLGVLELTEAIAPKLDEAERTADAASLEADYAVEPTPMRTASEASAPIDGQAHAALSH
jgi:hypothetical protein